MTEERGYTWDFGDGAVSHEESPTHTYTTPGTYTVTLTVAGPRGFDQTTHEITVSRPNEPIADKIKRYFPWRGDGTGMVCGACCAGTVDQVEASGGWIGDFLMLYPNCIGSRVNGVPNYPPDHLCYAYPVGFAYPLLGFFGGNTTETASYPPLWTGKLKINGVEFDLENPDDFGVNRGGLGIIAPQQYGWVGPDGRYWSLAAGHRLVEHLPDVVIYPDYDIDVSADLYIEHAAYPELLPVETDPHNMIISPKNCDEYDITAAELADPETMLSRCFHCGLGFPLAWLMYNRASASWNSKGIFPNVKPMEFYGIRGVKIL